MENWVRGSSLETNLKAKSSRKKELKVHHIWCVLSSSLSSKLANLAMELGSDYGSGSTDSCDQDQTC
ncbi:hypothetical protein HanRHA438_Chr03g0133401 [Helianthus annuus]|nr:hypothetical protein HanIR_Chr03g0132761 [Helianthus annuus]KAJ0936637.1 hypothetical protein HanRHA438_Chr03g0133401 [Helianthus annuus]